jgi:IclR family transcriptional regulator, acetate operon repressor
MKQSQKPYAGTQAVLRALYLLKTFRDDRPSWSLAELSKELKLNKTTVYRLLTALESEGLVRRQLDAENYALGPEMVTLGARAMRSYSLRDACRAELKTLAEISHETATLEILSGRDVLILDEIRGSHLLGSVPSVGTRWPAFATSTGKAMLAHLPEDQVSIILKGSLHQYTPKTITDPARLRKEFEETRRRGYAIADEVLELGFRAVGAALFQHDGEVAGAISLGGPVVRFQAERMSEFGKRISAVAKRISTRLGYETRL